MTDVRGIDIQSVAEDVAPCELCGKPCHVSTTRLGVRSHAHPCCVMNKASKRNPCMGCKASEAANGMQEERAKTRKKKK